MVLESTCSTPRNPLNTTKEFFKADLSTNTSTTILFVFSFHVFFFNLVIPGRSKALISTRKRNPEDSGRSSKMVSSCQWPFSSFLLALSLLKSSFYFN